LLQGIVVEEKMDGHALTSLLRSHIPQGLSSISSLFSSISHTFPSLLDEPPREKKERRRRGEGEEEKERRRRRRGEGEKKERRMERKEFSFIFSQ
jgi:hypothetical protein